MSLLSVCIPCFNRAKELDKLFRSVVLHNKDDVTFVVVDDGSEDETWEVVSHWGKIYDIDYLYQTNAGRANAVYKAVLRVSSKYLMIFDSDDIFLKDGLSLVLHELKNNFARDCFVFGMFLGKAEGSILISERKITNFLAMRAENMVCGDCKEVIRTTLVQMAIYQPYTGCRRVPTSLLLNTIAGLSDCEVIPVNVGLKSYLPSGMSHQIESLKRLYAKPMALNALVVATSDRYKSRLFRFKYQVCFWRYSLSANIKPALCNFPWALPFGALWWCASELRYCALFQSNKE